MNTEAQKQLRDFVNRAEALNAESKALTEAKKELREEIKAAGIDPKHMNEALRLLDFSVEERDKIDTYVVALGGEDAAA